MTFSKLHFFFHYICYYAAWVLGVMYVAAGKGVLAATIVVAITALQVAWQYQVQKRTQGLLLMVLIFTLAGFIVDSIFLYEGMILFNANPWLHAWSPPWMISLWISFAVSYYAVMDKLWRRYWLIGFLSLFAVPFAYYAGIRLGVASLPKGIMSLGFYGLAWCVLLPTLSFISTLIFSAIPHQSQT